jgi:hypothetical protein
VVLILFQLQLRMNKQIFASIVFLPRMCKLDFLIEVYELLDLTYQDMGDLIKIESQCNHVNK